MPNQPAGQATPLRTAPRVAVNTSAKIGTAPQKPPISQSRVLNVSTGGALLLANARQTEGATIYIELGPPVFAEPALLAARVAHVDPAPPHLAALLAESGKPGAKRGALYLLGVQFVNLSPEHAKTIAAFVRQRVELERKRRGDESHSARDRAPQTRRIETPRWAYALGLVAGLYRGLTGLAAGENDLTVALTVLATLGLAWFAGRCYAAVWAQLETWHAPEAIVIAHQAAIADDGTIPDADSTLLVAGADDEADALPNAAPPTPLPSPVLAQAS